MDLHEQCLLDVESEYQSLLQAPAPDNTQGDKQSSPHPTVSQLESQRLSLDTQHLLRLLLHLAFLEIMPVSYPLKEWGGEGCMRACTCAHAHTPPKYSGWPLSPVLPYKLGSSIPFTYQFCNMLVNMKKWPLPYNMRTPESGVCTPQKVCFNFPNGFCRVNDE